MEVARGEYKEFNGRRSTTDKIKTIFNWDPELQKIIFKQVKKPLLTKDSIREYGIRYEKDLEFFDALLDLKEIYLENKKEKAEIAGKPFKAGADYMVLVMLLKSLGIEANILQLECKNLKEYHSIDEAINRSIWRLGDLEEENRIALENYFKEIFIKNERGNWVNPKDKTDLVLIWWKKEE